jgi:cytochrome c oxidase cbb3-type subunit 3
MSQEPKRGHFAKAKGEIILREHEFDGIQEYDQKLPNWWLFTFYAAIVWFVCHWALYYQAGVMQTPQQFIVQEITKIQKAKDAEVAKLVAELNDAKFVHNWAKDPERVQAGEGIFLSICAQCHAADLTAKGPNGPLPGLPLNDHQWKFGGKPMDIFKLVMYGSPPESTGNNGAKMQAWGQTQLSPKQVAEVVSYLITKLPDDFKNIPAP